VSIQVDLWGGDLHQAFIDTKSFETLTDAVVFIQEALDCGQLVNLLHTDFRVPEHRGAEENAAMLALLQSYTNKEI